MALGILGNIDSNNHLVVNWHQVITETISDYLSSGLLGTIFNEIYIKYKHFHSRKCILKTHLQRGSPLIEISI